MPRRAFSDEFTIFTAILGAGALEIPAREEIAVILVDQRMPGMTGVQRCWSRPGTSARRRWASSARATSTTPRSARRSTWAQYAALSRKPWELGELRRRVNEVVRQYRAPTYTNGELPSPAYEERHVR